MSDPEFAYLTTRGRITRQPHVICGSGSFARFRPSFLATGTRVEALGGSCSDIVSHWGQARRQEGLAMSGEASVIAVATAVGVRLG